MKNKTHLTDEGFNLLLGLKVRFSKGIKANVFKNFPNFDIVKSQTCLNVNICEPYVLDNNLLDNNYIAGFTAADGCFYLLKPSKTGLCPNYDAGFSVAQDSSDKQLLARIIQTLGCGNINTDNEGMCYARVGNKQDLVNIIIPFFLKNTP